jgi:hypothetical protein
MIKIYGFIDLNEAVTNCTETLDFVHPVVYIVFKVFQWSSTQQPINAADIKTLISCFIIYIYCMFRSERSSSEGTDEYIFIRTVHTLRY